MGSEWAPAVFGPPSPRPSFARDLGDSGLEHERRFEYVLTYDRDLATQVAGTLMARVTASVGAESAPPLA
ncbi:MAG: hypothetical protein ACR2MA_12690 [Egibacteraceae bacterium]